MEASPIAKPLSPDLRFRIIRLWAVIDRPDRNFPSDGRIESGTAPPPTAARRYPYVDEQAVDGCRGDRENMIAICQARLQSPMLLKGRQQDRNHHVEPLAAHPVRRLP